MAADGYAEVMMLSRGEAEALLSKLCIELGFCLSPIVHDRLASDPPKDARAFTDAVFSAEGMNPATADRHLYRQVQDMISAAFSPVVPSGGAHPNRR